MREPLLEVVMGLVAGVAMMIVMAAGFGLAVGVYQVSKCWVSGC